MVMKLEPSSKNLDSLIEQYNRELMKFYERNAPQVTPDKPQAAEAPPQRQENAAELPLQEARIAYPARIVSPPEETHKGLRPVDEVLKEYPVPELYRPEQEETASKPAKAFSFTNENPLGEGTLPGVPLVDALDAAQMQEKPGESTQEMHAPAFPSLVEHPDNMSIGYLQIQVTSAREAEPIPGALITVTRRNGQGEELYIHTRTDKDGLTAIFPVPAVDSALTLEPGIPSPYTSYNIQAFAPGFFRVLNVNAPVYGGNKAVQPVQMIPIPEFELSPEDLVFFQTGPQDL